MREGLKREFGNDNITLDGFTEFIHGLNNLVGRYGFVKGELVRAYYYDAIVDEAEKEKRREQNEFFRKIRNVPFCTVRLGRLVGAGKNYRQKGVDILMAIDMLTKAYLGQYQIAVLVAGDADFVNLVEAVKDAGKRVYGVYFEQHISERLFESFDLPTSLKRQQLEAMISK